jgi:hypothetical protein
LDEANTCVAMICEIFRGIPGISTNEKQKKKTLCKVLWVLIGGEE